MTECLKCGLTYIYQDECPNCKVRKALGLELKPTEPAEVVPRLASKVDEKTAKLARRVPAR